MKIAGNMMLRGVLVIAVLLMSACSGSTGSGGGTNARPLPMIPLPAKVTRETGHFKVTAQTVISVPPADRQAAWTAHYLARMLARTRGLHLEVRVERKASPGVIRLQLDSNAPVTQEQGYALDVSKDGMSVRARSQAGLFYGAVSVWQLLTPGTGQGPVKVPFVSIRDWPRFQWRGFMLDSARHMQSVAEIKQLLNQMALHKLDVFHWHLTDDQGWRLQIKGYPKLTRVGAWRTPPGAGTHGEPKRYGGFYTQDQVREIVRYAAARHITVVPEIDMPGHAQAAVASYPEVLGSTSTHPKVAVKWGINPYLFSVDKPSMDMVRDILGEVLELFPSTYIHVGGDEAIKNQWQTSPVAQAKIKALGLKNEDALQSWFIGRLGHFLTRHDRRLIGWDEILEGGDLPADAVVESWHGSSGAVKAAKRGHDTVLAPYGSLYLSHLQSKRSDEPSGVFPILALAKVYAFDPAPASLDAAQKKHVLGTEAALWTELVSSPWEVEHAVFPRLDAFAEAAWSPQSARDFSSFLKRLPAQMQRYRDLDVAAAGSAFAVNIKLPKGRAAALATGTARVTLDNQTHFGRIHYTTDGSRPTLKSAMYTQPFDVPLPTTIRAIAFSDAGIALADTSTRTLNSATLLTRTSSQLHACADHRIGDRVPLLPDLGSRETPQYNIGVFASCWIYPDASLDDVNSIRVDAARLARNRRLLKQAQAQVAAYRQHSPTGDLQVHLDSCKGPLVADIALPAGDAVGETFQLESALQVPKGQHDLCLRFAAPVEGPLYAIGAVHLLTQ